MILRGKDCCSVSLKNYPNYCELALITVMLHRLAAYLDISKLANPGTIFIRTFDPRIQYFTMARNIRENLKRDPKTENCWQESLAQSSHSTLKPYLLLLLLLFSCSFIFFSGIIIIEQNIFKFRYIHGLCVDNMLQV